MPKKFEHAYFWIYRANIREILSFVKIFSQKLKISYETQNPETPTNTSFQENNNSHKRKKNKKSNNYRVIGFIYIRVKAHSLQNGDANMAPIAGPQITLMMLKAMTHDLTFRINRKMDSRMRLSQSSIFIGNQKAALYQRLGQCDPNDPNNKALVNSINAALQAYEAREKALASYEKYLDMEITNLQNQLKQAEAREQAAEKMVEKGCQSIAGTMGRG